MKNAVVTDSHSNCMFCKWWIKVSVHRHGQRYDLGCVNIFYLDILWLQTGLHAWIFCAWKQTHGKAEGGDASQSLSPLYSQKGVWKCFEATYLSSWNSIHSITCSAQEIVVILSIFENESLLHWIVKCAIKIVMHFQRELPWAIISTGWLVCFYFRAWRFLAFP